jgi:hypothetical protein
MAEANKLKKIKEAEEFVRKANILRKEVSDIEIDEKKRNIKNDPQRAFKDNHKTIAIGLIDSALKIYKSLCLNQNIRNDEKCQIFFSFYSSIPDEALDMLTRWRDMMLFLKGKSQLEMVELLTLIAKNSLLDGHNRTSIAVVLYNYAYLNECYEICNSIATDKGKRQDGKPNVLHEYRIEACRYLFASENDEYKELSQECLIEMLEDQSLKSEYRYTKIIACFISVSGIKTFFNDKKLRTLYDEDFVYGLQSTFFNNPLNGVRERILSGQHILSMENSPIAEKTEIANILLEIANNTEFEENVRADAADVVLRLGIDDQRKKARHLIGVIGNAKNNVNNEDPLTRVNTLYNNSQNIHDENIEKSVATFIEKMLNDNSFKIDSYEVAHTEVAEMVKTREIERRDNFLILKALNRIAIDTAKFTSFNVTLAEIFAHVWSRIKTYKGDIRNTLNNRLIEELIDMGDTCSSGHSGRFVNVLAIVDDDLRIGFDAQIIANVAGRINARIKTTKDIEERAAITMGMSPNAAEEDKIIYTTFITKATEELHTELYKEFVNGKYISEKEFEEYFREAIKPWMDFTKRSN